MKKEKHLEINENNYKGYVELYETYLMPMTTDENKEFIKFIKKLLIGVGIMVIGSFGSAIITNFNTVLTLSLSVASANVGVGYLLFSDNINEKRKKLKIKEKYPYIDLSLDMMEVEKALKEAKILVYEENHVLLDVKSYEQRLESEKEIREGLEKKDNNENLDELIKDSEQKIKDNTYSMEEYKANIKQEKIRLEALKRIKQERENQAFSEEKNNIEIPSQEKGLVLRKQKED